MKNSDSFERIWNEDLKASCENRNLRGERSHIYNLILMSNGNIIIMLGIQFLLFLFCDFP